MPRADQGLYGRSGRSSVAASRAASPLKRGTYAPPTPPAPPAVVRAAGRAGRGPGRASSAEDLPGTGRGGGGADRIRPRRTTITNTVSVTGDVTDPNEANNSASIRVSVASGSAGKRSRLGSPPGPWRRKAPGSLLPGASRSCTWAALTSPRPPPPPAPAAAGPAPPPAAAALRSPPAAGCRSRRSGRYRCRPGSGGR